ncbi:MAG: hypothetical protein JXA71_03390 [Chitinispirillaceae bacterium]|nr:hypothetical protein [Chitinispirillaceae bacterium]
MRKTHCFFAAGLFSLVLISGLTAAWQPTDGPGGGQVNALAIMGTHLLAGTSDSGVFRSSDSGVHWLAVNTGLTNRDIKALTVRGTALFAGTYGGGVFRSTDSGAHWEAINTGISTLNIQALGGNDSFLFAGTSGGGVCRSSDSGVHWLEVSNGLVHVNIFSIGVTRRYVFVGTWGGSAFRTEDNGLNWYLVTNGLFDPRENIIPYCFAVADTFLFAGTGGGGIFRAKDSARAWYPFATGLPDTAFVTALALREDTLFAATQNGVFRSIANGDEAHWVPDNDGLANAVVVSFVISGGTLFAGTKGNGVWRRSLSVLPIPLPPVLSSPDNDVSGIAVKCTLSWSASSGATSYAVQVSTASDFSTQIVNQSGITSTSYTVNSLLNNTTCYWRVNAANTSGTSAWTMPWSFSTIMASPATPVAILPDSGAVDIIVTPSLSWHSAQSASSYRVQLSTNGSFVPLLLDSGTIKDTLFLLSGLARNALYFWRVASVNAASQSPWSRSMSFTTIGALPEMVVVVPAINDTLRIDSLLCKWKSANPQVTSYQLDVYSDSLAGEQVISDSTISDTTFLLRHLPNNRTFWWRVRARNVAGWGLFSNGSKIIVRIPTTVVLPSSFTVVPSGSSLHNGVFRYGIPVQCVVSLTVFDMRGKSIRHYTSAPQTPGYYHVRLNRSAMATGRYLLRFAAGDHQRIIPFFVH